MHIDANGSLPRWSEVIASARRLRRAALGGERSTEGMDRSQQRRRRARLNAGASAATKVITLITGLVSVPLTLHYLGAERYGMWLALSSVATMFAFADLGVGNGLINAVAAANGRDDRAAVRRSASSGLATLSLIALTLGATFAAVYTAVPWAALFNVRSAVARAEAGPAIAVFFAAFAFGLPVEVVERVQMGLQKSFMAQVWRCVASLMSLAGVLLAIWLKAGLPWLVFALSGVPVIVIGLNAVTFFGVLARDLRPSLSGVDFASARQITQTGSLFFLLQVAAGVTKYSDNLVIARLLGSAMVPVYAAPERLFAQISGVAMMMLWPLWPAYGEAMARGDLAWVKSTFFISSRRTLILSSVLAVFLVMTGQWIVSVWTGHTLHPTFCLLLGLGVWKVMECMSFAFGVFFNGLHRIRLQVITALLTAACSIVLEIILVAKIGVSGAVWATVVTFALFTLAPWLVYLRREVRTLG